MHKLHELIHSRAFDEDTIGKWACREGFIMGTALLAGALTAASLYTGGATGYAGISLFSSLISYTAMEWASAVVSLSDNSIQADVQLLAGGQISLAQYFESLGVKVGVAFLFAQGGIAQGLFFALTILGAVRGSGLRQPCGAGVALQKMEQNRNQMYVGLSYESGKAEKLLLELKAQHGVREVQYNKKTGVISYIVPQAIPEMPGEMLSVHHTYTPSEVPLALRMLQEPVYVSAGIPVATMPSFAGAGANPPAILPPGQKAVPTGVPAVVSGVVVGAAVSASPGGGIFLPLAGTLGNDAKLPSPNVARNSEAGPFKPRELERRQLARTFPVENQEGNGFPPKTEHFGPPGRNYAGRCLAGAHAMDGYRAPQRGDNQHVAPKSNNALTPEGLGKLSPEQHLAFEIPEPPPPTIVVVNPNGVRYVGGLKLGTSHVWEDRNGWKLHLSVAPEDYQEVHNWLWRRFRKTDIGYKFLGGVASADRSFTIYIGDKKMADAIAKELSDKIGNFLRDPRSIRPHRLVDDRTVHITDIPLAPKVWGRFDQSDLFQSGKLDLEFTYNTYGGMGIPYFKGDYHRIQQLRYNYGQRRTYDQEIAAAMELSEFEPQALARSFDALKSKYGDFFTGGATNAYELSSERLPVQNTGERQIEFLPWQFP